MQYFSYMLLKSVPLDRRQIPRLFLRILNCDRIVHPILELDWFSSTIACCAIFHFAFPVQLYLQWARASWNRNHILVYFYNYKKKISRIKKCTREKERKRIAYASYISAQLGAYKKCTSRTHLCGFGYRFQKPCTTWSQL